MNRPAKIGICVASSLLAACSDGNRGPRGLAPETSVPSPSPTTRPASRTRLPPPPLTPERRATLEADLSTAQSAYDVDPKSEDAAIWLGRRLAYLGRYDDAIDTFTRALAAHPE